MVDFLTVDPWIRKVNREFVLKAIEEKPTLILTFTHRQIRAGALAQIRAAVDTALVNIWPDTLVNWGTHHTANLPMSPGWLRMETRFCVEHADRP